MKLYKDKEVKSFAEVDISDLKMPVIAVYCRPEDYPENCVARIFDIDKPSNIILIKDDIATIRTDIRNAYPQLFPFPPGTGDVPSLVEAWI